MTKGLFITGTDTDVGKTAVAVAILQQCVLQRIDCRAYKPVASGIQSGPTDIDRLWSASGNAGGMMSTRNLFNFLLHRNRLLPLRERRLMMPSCVRVYILRCLQNWFSSRERVVYFHRLPPDAITDLAQDFQVPVIVVDSSRLGAIGRIDCDDGAEAVGLTVAAMVLSQTETGHAGGNKKIDSPQAILCQSRAELQRRIPHIVICSLGYNESTIEPFVEWHTIAAQLDMPTKHSRRVVLEAVYIFVL